VAGDDHIPLQRNAGCPICGKPAATPHHPFCSKRCRDIDLGRWLRGVYRVETEEVADDEPSDAG
jgi:endogenous inhibitor of DNA gyrase (YacG/DUF329 family)